MLFRMKDEKAHQLEAELDKLQADGPAAWAKLPEEELFTPAGFSEERAEATSYSNYSYWGSTFRAFFKNRVAVLLLVVMAVSLLSVCALAADDGEDVAKSITCTTCNGTGISQGEECGVCEGTGEITSTSRMAFSFWALVPPIVAIILALITKEVYSSLFVGILLGALFYSNFNPIIGLDAIITDGLTPAVADNAGIMLFLVILGAMVALINAPVRCLRPLCSVCSSSSMTTLTA